MPEIPDLAIYLERLDAMVVGKPLVRLRILNPFVLRSVSPPVSEIEGSTVTGTRRVGKRIVLAFEGERFVVIHLMIAGRLRWRPPGKTVPGKLALAGFEFTDGTLFLTEAGSKRRASMHVVHGEAALAQFDRGGIEPMTASLQDTAARLRSENHTLKRALTDPRLFSGIGNAYSDEILHAARLSPMLLTSRITDEQIATLYDAMRATLQRWIDHLRAETGSKFPDQVTAFHEDMAAHGRFGKPCPVCGAPIQRIRYADNETNYCARCQTGGRLLADRAMSRLLKDDWPRSLDELDA
jgi:formamidopyrimidine-DNA glycosylase